MSGLTAGETADSGRRARSLAPAPESPPAHGLADELHARVRIRSTQQLLDRAPPLLAVVPRQLVHVHVDEPAGGRVVETAREAERIGKCLVTVLQRRLDRLAEHTRKLFDSLNVPAVGVHPERKRQSRPPKPPLTEIDALHQAGGSVGPLALVDQQPAPRAP